MRDRKLIGCPLCEFSILPPPLQGAEELAAGMLADHATAHPAAQWLAEVARLNTEVTRLSEEPGKALARAVSLSPEALMAMIAPFSGKAVAELRIAAETVRIACVAELLDRRDR